MKTIKLAAIVLGMVGMVAGIGCDKALDETPISTIPPDKFWKDKNDAINWVAGIYNSLQSTLRTNWFDWGEVRSDNVRVGGTGNAQLTMITNTLSANDADINGTTRWTDMYTTISLCNYGIKYLPPMIDQNLDGGASVYRELLGQCYAMRALMYFYGLRVWGKLPIHTIPVESISQPNELPRSPIADIKQRIMEDITESLKTIGNSTSLKYNIQKAAVYALKTDVHMWFQEYDDALTASQSCITESKCTWVTSIVDWKRIFLDPVTSTETIFTLYWSSVERGNGVGVCQKLGSSSNTNQYEIVTPIWQELKDRIDTVSGKSIDGRYWALWDTLTYNNPTTYDDAVVQLGKFYPWKPNAPLGTGFVLEGNNDCNAKIPIYRFADVMLLRAEALNRKGRHQEALDIVNAVRSRVGYTVQALLTDYTGDIMAEIERTILKERQLELLGEGKRWFDMCRIGTIYNYTTGYEYLREIMNPILASRNGAILYEGENMGRILYPINSDVIKANAKLSGDQNPPYDE
ncbi:MAG TPA: RagB/SusD family nutrient uptake outer membrane protein [Chitinophagaceae bacterium]|nr:RagB/SusD family nutrient uptake outer membrane protein [Chitinophagaceae bacterium]